MERFVKASAAALSALLVAALFAACPSPFGYYAGGNTLLQTVTTTDTSSAIPAATPVFRSTPLSGGTGVIVSGAPTESADQTIALETATAGARIYYTTDGSTPDPYKPGTRLYDPARPISAKGNNTVVTINAIAIKPLMLPSGLATLAMTISYTTASTPAFDVAAGSYNGTLSVTITDSTPGATIWYTTDGTTPTEGGGGATLSGVSPIPVSVTSTTTLTAIASAPGYTTSGSASALYELVVLPPIISVPGGTILGGETNTIAAQTGGSLVWYTTDGTTPIPGSSPGGAASVSLTLWRSATVKAIAAMPSGGWTPSTVASASYASGLQLYFPFNDVPGSPTTADVSGGNWTANINGAVLSPDRNAVSNAAYSFDGTASTITQPSFGFPTSSTVSVSLWVNCPVATPGVSYFVRTNDGGIGIWQTGSQVGLAISTPTTNSAGATISLNSWHFIVGTWDGTTINFYVDGALAGTGTNPGTITPSGGLTMGLFNGTYWQGVVDDLRIYDRVLTPAEIASLYSYTY